MEQIVNKHGMYLQLHANEKGYVHCPFCTKYHKHGKGNGHRVPDCGSAGKDIYYNGVFYEKANGYYVIFM